MFEHLSSTMSNHCRATLYVMNNDLYVNNFSSPLLLPQLKYEDCSSFHKFSHQLMSHDHPNPPSFPTWRIPSSRFCLACAQGAKNISPRKSRLSNNHQLGWPSSFVTLLPFTVLQNQVITGGDHQHAIHEDAPACRRWWSTVSAGTGWGAVAIPPRACGVSLRGNDQYSIVDSIMELQLQALATC